MATGWGEQTVSYVREIPPEVHFFVFAIVLFFALLTRPSHVQHHWRGIEDARFRSALVVGCVILFACVVLLYLVGAPLVGWWILVTFSFVPLLPLCIAWVTPDAQHSLQALLQHITMLNRREELILISWLFLLPLTSLVAMAVIGSYVTTTDAYNGAVTGAEIAVAILSGIAIYVVHSFSTQSVIVWSNRVGDSIDSDYQANGPIYAGQDHNGRHHHPNRMHRQDYGSDYEEEQDQNADTDDDWHRSYPPYPEPPSIGYIPLEQTSRALQQQRLRSANIQRLSRPAGGGGPRVLGAGGGTRVPVRALPSPRPNSGKRP